MNDMEKNFSDFIDGVDYDTAQQALFDIIRKAYAAGYSAASSNEEKDKILEVHFAD